MPAFNLEYERRRLAEGGMSDAVRARSVKDNLRTLVAERTLSPSHFELRVSSGVTTGIGYEQRGDLSRSFQKSEAEAPNDRIIQRYRLENEGFEKAKKEFFRLPLYSTIMLWSPPPDEPIPGYPGHSFAYFYHVLPGRKEEERTIKALAWINYFSKEDQADFLNELNEDGAVQPTEGSILTSPVIARGGNGTESFRAFWQTLERQHKEKGYNSFMPSASVMEQQLLRGDEIMRDKHLELDIIMEDVAKRLAEGATQNEIAREFNIMLGLADKELLHKHWEHQDLVLPREPNERVLPPLQAIIAMNSHHGENVRAVETYCGISEGMTLEQSPTSLFGTTEKTASINSFTFKISKESTSNSENTVLCCKCPFCKELVDAKIDGGRIYCPECGKSAPYSKSK